MPAPARPGGTVRTLRTVLTVLMALVLLASLAAAAAGVWFVRELGTSGSASFSTSPDAATLVEAGPQVLARNDTAVTVRVKAADADTPLWVGLARPSDAEAALGTARRTVLTGVDLDGWQVRTSEEGSQDPAGVTTGDIWTSTARGTGEVEVTVSRGAGAQTLVVAGADGKAVDLDAVSLTWTRGTWFVQALAVTIAGLLIAVIVGVSLLRRITRAIRVRRGGTEPEPPPVGRSSRRASVVEAEPAPAPRTRTTASDEATIVLTLDKAAAESATHEKDRAASFGPPVADRRTEGAATTGPGATDAEGADAEPTDAEPTDETPAGDGVGAGPGEHDGTEAVTPAGTEQTDEVVRDEDAESDPDDDSDRDDDTDNSADPDQDDIADSDTEAGDTGSDSADDDEHPRSDRDAAADDDSDDDHDDVADSDSDTKAGDKDHDSADDQHPRSDRDDDTAAGTHDSSADDDDERASADRSDDTDDTDTDDTDTDDTDETRTQART